MEFGRCGTDACLQAMLRHGDPPFNLPRKDLQPAYTRSVTGPSQIFRDPWFCVPRLLEVYPYREEIMPIKLLVPKFREGGQVLCRRKKCGAAKDIASHQALEDDKDRKTPKSGGIRTRHNCAPWWTRDFIHAVSLKQVLE